MEIDNSGANAFRRCPFCYYYGYLYPNADGTLGLEKVYTGTDVRARDFGTRGHELLENHYRESAGLQPKPYPESENPALELEAQAMYAAYCNHYPVESFRVVDVERTVRLPLGDSGHTYVAKMDLAFEEEDFFGILDHKFESRTSRRNTPMGWAVRDQATLYMWAASQLYGRVPRHLLLNVCRRQSPKGREGPEFYRQTIQRTPEQMERAVRDLILIADTIEDYRKRFEGRTWPSNFENCCGGFFLSDFYTLHLFGESPEILRQYQPKKPYLDM